MSDFLIDLFRSMPKTELHVHLDGALEVRTAIELIAKRGEPIPGNLGGLSLPLSYETLHGRLVISKPLATQAELLGYYDLPIELMQSEEALSRVTNDLLRAKAADRVSYCEIRWAPVLHCAGGMDVARVAESVCRAAKRACERYGIRARLIVVGMRSHSPETNIDMLRRAKARDSDGLIVAADLAGPEAADPDPSAQKPFFDEARRLGLGVTLHCGELPGSADAIMRAVRLIGPDRIAHGSGAAYDEGLCRLLAEDGVQLDLCPTSNIQAGLYAGYAEFPAEPLYARGVPISISTDSPVVSGLTLSEEYCCLARAGRLSPAELWKINRASIDHIVADAQTKRAHREEFASWADGLSEFCGAPA
jgi:adenosine deaminase